MQKKKGRKLNCFLIWHCEAWMWLCIGLCIAAGLFQLNKVRIVHLTNWNGLQHLECVCACVWSCVCVCHISLLTELTEHQLWLKPHMVSLQLLKQKLVGILENVYRTCKHTHWHHTYTHTHIYTHIDTHWLKHTLCKKKSSYNRHAQHQMN